VSKVQELWIPRRAPNLNDLLRAKGAGPHAYNALKKSWAQTVAVCTMRDHTRRFSRCSLHFEIVESDKRRDPDGFCSGAAKLILDGLVKATVLGGDGWAHVAGLSFSWRVGTEPGVLVRIEEVAHA
jgi:hypothetical protein